MLHNDSGGLQSGAGLLHNGLQHVASTVCPHAPDVGYAAIDELWNNNMRSVNVVSPVFKSTLEVNTAATCRMKACLDT